MLELARVAFEDEPAWTYSTKHADERKISYSTAGHHTSHFSADHYTRWDDAGFNQDKKAECSKATVVCVVRAVQRHRNPMARWPVTGDR